MEVGYLPLPDQTPAVEVGDLPLPDKSPAVEVGHLPLPDQSPAVEVGDLPLPDRSPVVEVGDLPLPKWSPVVEGGYMLDDVGTGEEEVGGHPVTPGPQLQGKHLPQGAAQVVPGYSQNQAINQ